MNITWRYALGWTGLMGVLLAPFARAAEPSPSRLSIHLIQNYSAGAHSIINAHPRVIKILDVQGPMMTAAREFKAGTPHGVVVLRVYTTRHYSATDNATASAQDFWNTVLAPAVNILSPADKALIDYLEGPNECESTPCWGGTLADTEWFNTFWLELAQKIADNGFKPCAFSIPVGNPPGTVTEIQQKLDRIVPALRKCKQLGGAWSYHSYTGPYTTDVATEMWYSLRYRQYYSYFASRYPDLATMPLILTEGGVDTGGNPNSSGWQAQGSADKYKNWLTWYDARLREDAYVVGCTLFQCGTSGWPSFEVEPIAAWLATHIGTPAIQCSPGTLAPSAAWGSNPPADTLNVANTGAGVIHYTASVDAAWLSISPASGSSTGESDPFTISYNTRKLISGTRTAHVTFTDANAANSPLVVPVTLNIIQLHPPGDANGDNDVDASDLNAFIGCFTGPNKGPFKSGCASSDLDRDDDVDLDDFGLFQRCMTGTGIHGDVHCAD